MLGSWLGVSVIPAALHSHKKVSATAGAVRNFTHSTEWIQYGIPPIYQRFGVQIHNSTARNKPTQTNWKLWNNFRERMKREGKS